jgi:3-methyladenine DNA glycosylase AlkC
MPYKLKHFYDEALIRSLADDLRRVHRSFDSASFVEKSLCGLSRLELTQRAAKIAEVLRDELPKDYRRAVAVLLASLGPPLERSDEFGMAPFRYLPHVLFVARYGLDDFETSMRAQYELTQRFSAEGSIRAFLIKYPERTYAKLREWSSDPNVHVRRLVSEGTRPRLPWAQRLRDFQRDPRPVLELLERLKDDPERYVQRSVANNLNDIGKDHPELLVKVCRRWSKGASPARHWIVRHALRSLIKRGDRGALATLGYASKPEIMLQGLRLEPARVKLGSALRFSVELTSKSRQTQELLVDYAVHFVKLKGGLRPKVFKLKKIVLPPRERIALGSRISFAPMTTRKSLPGRHKLELLVNGVSYPLGEFSVYG